MLFWVCFGRRGVVFMLVFVSVLVVGVWFLVVFVGLVGVGLVWVLVVGRSRCLLSNRSLKKEGEIVVERMLGERGWE